MGLGGGGMKGLLKSWDWGVSNFGGREFDDDELVLVTLFFTFLRKRKTLPHSDHSPAHLISSHQQNSNSYSFLFFSLVAISAR